MDVTRFSIGGLADSFRAMGGSVSGCPSKGPTLAALAACCSKTSGMEFQKGQARSKAPPATLHGKPARWWLRRARNIHGQ